MSKLELQKLLLIVAEKCEVNAEEFAEELQANINAVYEKPTRFALSVPRKNAVPTLYEVMNYLCQIVLLHEIKNRKS